MSNTPRLPLNILVNPTGRAEIIRRAKDEAKGNTSEMARRMLKFASLHMPEGWK